MKRAILHSDLNAFYASVEMMLNPSLRDRAVAVCGSTEDNGVCDVIMPGMMYE